VSFCDRGHSLCLTCHADTDMLSCDMGFLTQPPKPAIGAPPHPFSLPRRPGGACIQPLCSACVNDAPHGGGTLALAMFCARSISLEPPARPGQTSAAAPRPPRQAFNGYGINVASESFRGSWGRYS